MDSIEFEFPTKFLHFLKKRNVIYELISLFTDVNKPW